ncbi:MAG: cytochrome c3 family protein [Acidobacteriota bacterium]
MGTPGWLPADARRQPAPFRRRRRQKDLAHLLQRLAATAVAGFVLLCGAASAAPFSHKLHLKLVQKCETCHTTIGASTQAADNNLPRAEACLACHKEPAISAPRKMTVGLFNHQKHIAFGNLAPVILTAIQSKNYFSSPIDPTPLAALETQLKSLTPTTANAGCLSCHHGVAESEAPSMAMHANMPDCLVCHNKIDNPFSCEKCHTQDTHLMPASHTPDFVDRHSTAKMNLDKPSCVVCHGKKFRCLGCH